MPPHRPGILSAFLGKITRNLALNRLRQNGAEKRGGSAVNAVLEEIGEFLSDADTVETEINRKELIRAMDRFLDSLPAEKKLFLFVDTGILTVFPILQGGAE